MDFWKKLFGRTPPTPGVEETVITAFFASVDGYVTLAEQLPALQLSELMKEYFLICSDVIEAEGGTLDKFVGDVAVAWFGPPRNQPDHAIRACRAALRFHERLAELRKRLAKREDKWPEIARHIRGRIGIHTGEAIVGTIVRDRFTVMGDNVNFAARLEKGAKTYSAQTICTEATKAESEQSRPGAIVYRSLGKIVVKGRTLPVHLYEPMALSKQATPQLRECIGVFERGLVSYREMKWDEAESLFQESARLEPKETDNDRNPSIAFLGMVQQARINPPHPAFMP